jgi:hypothetical protein
MVMLTKPIPRNCAVRQYTADGRPVGRCYHHTGTDFVCQTHGDVAAVQRHFADTGQTTDERTLIRRPAPPNPESK